MTKSVAMGPNKVEDASREFSSRVQIVVCPAKGRTIGGCESRPGKPPEEPGSQPPASGEILAPKRGEAKLQAATNVRHALDALWAKEASHLGKIVRYADDLVILCRTESDARQAYAWLQRTAQALHLKVHSAKSRIVDLGEGAQGVDWRGGNSLDQSPTLLPVPPTTF
jgi:hypothetical protein